MSTFEIADSRRFGCSGNYSPETEALIKGLKGKLFEDEDALANLLLCHFGSLDESFRTEWSESEQVLWFQYRCSDRNMLIQGPCYPR